MDTNNKLSINTIRLLSLCGRYSAGKSTIVSFLCSNIDIIVYNPKRKISNMDYIISTLFGFDYEIEYTNDTIYKDKIWNLTFGECKMILRDLLYKFVDTNLYDELENTYYKNLLSSENNDISSDWIHLSFAEKLKIISAVIFNISLEILLGQTIENRIIRENIRTKNYNICGSLSGRGVLEFFGTNILRNNFCEDIWINILKRDIKYYNSIGKGVIISDVRYSNERKFIDEMGGKIFVVYRKEEDLILTDNDKQSHIAGWSFLEFIDINKDIYILNNTTIEDLKNKVYDLVSKLF